MNKSTTLTLLPITNNSNSNNKKRGRPKGSKNKKTIVNDPHQLKSIPSNYDHLLTNMNNNVIQDNLMDNNWIHNINIKNIIEENESNLSIDEEPLKKKLKLNHFDQTKTCSWCDHPRERNDLCNRCRQKVETRAKRLLEEKLSGDVKIMSQILQFFEQQTKSKWDTLDAESFFGAMKTILPAAMIRFQAEYQYKGKKGNNCWIIPDCILRKMIKETTNRQSNKELETKINQLSRKKLIQFVNDHIQDEFKQIEINVDMKNIKYHNEVDQITPVDISDTDQITPKQSLCSPNIVCDAINNTINDFNNNNNNNNENHNNNVNIKQYPSLPIATISHYTDHINGLNIENISNHNELLNMDIDTSYPCLIDSDLNNLNSLLPDQSNNYHSLINTSFMSCVSPFAYYQPCSNLTDWNNNTNNNNNDNVDTIFEQ